MTRCSVENCQNRDEKGYVMLRFPKDNALKRKWVLAINNKSGWEPKPGNRICEAHFKRCHWLKYSFRLKARSVPSIFSEKLWEEENKTYLCNMNDHRGACVITTAHHDYPKSSKQTEVSASADFIMLESLAENFPSKKVNDVEELMLENKKLVNEVAYLQKELTKAKLLLYEKKLAMIIESQVTK